MSTKVRGSRADQLFSVSWNNKCLFKFPASQNRSGRVPLYCSGAWVCRIVYICNSEVDPKPPLHDTARLNLT